MRGDPRRPSSGACGSGTVQNAGGGKRHDQFLARALAIDDPRQSTLAQDGDAMTDAEQLGEVGGYDESSDPLCREPVDDGIDFVLDPDVDADRRFVEYQNAGIRREPPRKDDFLAVAAAQGFNGDIRGLRAD